MQMIEKFVCVLASSVPFPSFLPSLGGGVGGGEAPDHAYTHIARLTSAGESILNDFQISVRLN